MLLGLYIVWMAGCWSRWCVADVAKRGACVANTCGIYPCDPSRGVMKHDGGLTLSVLLSMPIASQN